jgi:hypothetical protein
MLDGLVLTMPAEHRTIANSARSALCEEVIHGLWCHVSQDCVMCGCDSDVDEGNKKKECGVEVKVGQKHAESRSWRECVQTAECYHHIIRTLRVTLSSSL